MYCVLFRGPEKYCPERTGEFLEMESTPPREVQVRRVQGHRVRVLAALNSVALYFLLTLKSTPPREVQVRRVQGRQSTGPAHISPWRASRAADPLCNSFVFRKKVKAQAVTTPADLYFRGLYFSSRGPEKYSPERTTDFRVSKSTPPREQSSKVQNKPPPPPT